VKTAIVLFVIIAIITLLLSFRLRFVFLYSDNIVAKWGVGPLSFPIYPKVEKKIKISDYTVKKLKKKKLKLQKSIKKTQSVKSLPKKQAAPKPPISDTLSLIYDIASKTLRPFIGYLEIDMSRLYIRVGAEDAAKAAVEYGVAVQSAAYLIELLSNYTRLKLDKHAHINVVCDFLASSWSADISIVFKMRLYRIISLAFKAALAFAINRFKNTEKNSGGIDNGREQNRSDNRNFS